MCYKTYSPYSLEWNPDTIRRMRLVAKPSSVARLLSQAHMPKINRDHRARLVSSNRENFRILIVRRLVCEQAFGRAGNLGTCYFFPQTESLFTGYTTIRYFFFTRGTPGCLFGFQPLSRNPAGTIITGLKSGAILSVVDRNVAIFATRRAIARYEFQIIAKFAYILLPQIKYDCFDISKSFLWL